MIQKLSRKVVTTLVTASHQTIDDEQQEVYLYGMECFLNTGITVFLLFIWGVFLDTLLETIIWIISFSLLRKYSGGYHAHSQLSCIVSSTLLGISNTFALNFFNPDFCLLFPIFVLAIFVFIFLVPIISPTKPLSPLLAYRNKKIALFLIILYFFLSLILPPSIGITITHATITTCILVILSKLNFSIVKKG